MRFLKRFLWIFLDLLFPLPFDQYQLQKTPSSGQNNIHTHTSISLFDYRDTTTKKLIKYLKSHQSKRLFNILSSRINDHLDEYFSDMRQFGRISETTLVIPIPMYKKDQKKRGFNQNTLFGEYLAQRYKLKYAEDILIKNIRTKKQALVTKKAQRFSNIKNSMYIPQKRRPQKNVTVIIIDDLTTTGATLLEAEKVLRKAGVKEIISITLAH